VDEGLAEKLIMRGFSLSVLLALTAVQAQRLTAVQAQQRIAAQAQQHALPADPQHALPASPQQENLVFWAPEHAQMWAWFTAGVAVILSTAISTWTILNHLDFNKNIPLRNSTIRILLMVPVYAIVAYAGLVWRRQSPIFEVVRDCYEAWAIFSFMSLLLNYLDGPLVLAQELRGHKNHAHLPPFCCLPAWTMGPQFVHHCVLGVFQYSIAMPLMTVIAFIGWLFNDYCPGQLFNPYCVYMYMMVIHNVSQIVAMYSLVLFYHATRDLLAPINPLGKLLCIKAVVFFTFWQGLIIQGMAHKGLISASNWEDNGGWTTEEIADGLQDYIICIEMLIFSIVHTFVFSHKDPYIRAFSERGQFSPKKAVNLRSATKRAELASNMQSAALIHRDLIGEFYQLRQLQTEYRSDADVVATARQADSFGGDAMTKPGIGSWL
jgi:hypothetical protein